MRTSGSPVDLRNLRTLLAATEHAREQALQRRSGGYVTHRSTGDPIINFAICGVESDTNQNCRQQNSTSES